MGNWNINIQGVGCHHNTNNPTDANRMAQRFVFELQSAGHKVEHAAFTSGSKEPLITQLPTLTIEQEAARLYTQYCGSVGGKAFNGDPLPSWWDFANDPAKANQANAWRKVAEAALLG